MTAPSNARLLAELQSVAIAVRSADDVDVHVARQIDRRRKFHGMTQKDLAGLVGVSHQQIQKYEEGTNRVSAGRLFRIAAALECAPGDFFPQQKDPTQ